MYSCRFLPVRKRISQPLLAAYRYLFLMLSCVKAGALSKPCYQYTQRILGNPLASFWLVRAHKSRKMAIAVKQPGMMAYI